MNMTRQNYPKPKAYVQAWQRLKTVCQENPNAKMVGVNWWPQPVCEIQQEFITAMHKRINERGGLGKRGRKDNHEFFVRLLWDQRAIQAKVRDRVSVYQFQTAEARKRFGHLLDSPFEV